MGHNGEKAKDKRKRKTLHDGRWELNRWEVKDVGWALRLLGIIDPDDKRQISQQQKKTALYIHQLTVFSPHVPFLRARGHFIFFSLTAEYEEKG